MRRRLRVRCSACSCCKQIFQAIPNRPVHVSLKKPNQLADLYVRFTQIYTKDPIWRPLLDCFCRGRYQRTFV